MLCTFPAVAESSITHHSIETLCSCPLGAKGGQLPTLLKTCHVFKKMWSSPIVHVNLRPQPVASESTCILSEFKAFPQHITDGACARHKTFAQSFCALVNDWKLINFGWRINQAMFFYRNKVHQKLEPPLAMSEKGRASQASNVSNLFLTENYLPVRDLTTKFYGQHLSGGGSAKKHWATIQVLIFVGSRVRQCTKYSKCSFVRHLWLWPNMFLYKFF